MNTCPAENELADLVHGHLVDEDAEAITQHVGTCEECQVKMQDIAAGEVAVDALLAESTMAAPPDHSAYWNIRESLIKQPPADSPQNASALTFIGSEAKLDSGHSQGTATDADDANGEELTFLEPSDDPEYIGRLQHFQVSRVIGRGGMGVVLGAFDPDLHRSVAIKVLNAKYQNNKAERERFCREGRAAASISHEHVVPMHQVAGLKDSEIAFLVMQLIDGETLETRIEEQAPMPPGDVARIGMQIAAGLSAAHSNGLVHRDIKPGNILIERSTGRVKITDFGLARIDDEVRITQTGVLMGTVLYMSPEQALGGAVDERSDLFSLGAVMYEMATGKCPFRAPTAVGVMKQIMDENPPTPRAMNSKIGKPTSDLIMRMISKKPADRPESAAVVAHALARIVTTFESVSPLQISSIVSSNAARLTGQSRRNWLMLFLACATLLIVATFAFFFGDRLRLFAVEAAAVSVTWTADGGQPDVTDQFPTVLLDGNPGPVWSVAFSKDGKQVAAGIGDGSVRLWDIEKREVVRSFNAHRGNVWSVKFHPSLDLLVSSGDDSWVKLWDTKTFEFIHGWKADNTVRAIAFSSDNKFLAAGDRAGKVHIYDIDSKRELQTHQQEGTVLGIDFSSDGKLIATVGSDKTVRIFDTETFEQRQNMIGHAGPIYTVAFAPDGPLLATTGWGPEIWVWNSQTGESVLQIPGTTGDNWGLAIVGKGRHLLSGGQDGAARLWNLADGKQLATFRSHTQPILNIALDPRHRKIATGSRDGAIRIWDTNALSELAP